MSGCHSGAKEQAFRTVQSGVAPGRGAGRCPSTSPDVLPPGARGSLALEGPRLLCRRLCRAGTRTVTRNPKGDARGPKKPKNGECVRPGCGDVDEMLVGTGLADLASPRSSPESSLRSRTRRGGWTSSRTPGVPSRLHARRFRPDPGAQLGSSAPAAPRPPLWCGDHGTGRKRTIVTYYLGPVRERN